MKKRRRWSRRKSGPSKYNKQREGKMPSFAGEGERNLFFFWRVSALAHSPAQVRPLTDSFIITISADALRTRERETKYNEMLYSDGEIDWPSLFFSLASS